MYSTILLVDLLGAAALLISGLRLLKTGVNRAFGAQLRVFLASSTRNRFAAFGAGLATTLALQSSTAMAMIVSSFVAQGLVAPAMAQAVLLGANVGTSVVTQILALDLHWLAPAVILLAAAVGTRTARVWRGIGEAGLGLGLMLLSLKLMSEATEPMRNSEAVAAFFALLVDAPVIAVALSAALAAASASSLAVVLFAMSLAGTGALDATTCLLLVAGANLGGALPPLLAAATDGAIAQRVAASNLAVRALGTGLLMTTIGWITPLVRDHGSLARLVVDAHVGFNLVLALVFLPILGPLTHVLARIIPDRTAARDESPRHLDEAALSDPPAALAAATRETLRVGDVVQQMLETSLGALTSNDEAMCTGLKRLDDKVDALENAIKLYLSRLDHASLDAPGLRQADAILDYAVNLEHVGDIIEGSLARMTFRKIEKQLQFSSDGLAEIEALYLDTLENLQLAQNVFLSRDFQMARRLVESKVAIREKERASASRHMTRLQKKQPATVLTTELHLDILRDLRRINAHLATVAYPILEQAGVLRQSRLKKA